MRRASKGAKPVAMRMLPTLSSTNVSVWVKSMQLVGQNFSQALQVPLAK